MDKDELERRFRYHPPQTVERRALHELTRARFRQIADALNDDLPEGREKSLVFTALEEALMWANAAVARSQS